MVHGQNRDVDQSERRSTACRIYDEIKPKFHTHSCSHLPRLDDNDSMRKENRTSVLKIAVKDMNE